MAAALHVPVELVEDILSRVPVKSLLKFKTASKYWYCLLSRDLKFANFHLNQSKSTLLFFQVFSGKTTFQSVNIDTNESRIFSFPVKIECELVGAANGLICVAPCHKRSFFIWNPCTSECEEISMHTPGIRVFGFAYDSHSEDYKVVARDELFHIFSLKTNSWKILKTYVPSRDNALQFNGALHWCRLKDIIAFDLVEEKFSFIELPDEIKPIAKQYQSLAVVSLWEYQGFLCVSGGKSIWMMMKYRDTKSWVKLSQSLAENKMPLGISRLGEVVYRAKDRYGYVRSDIQGGMSNDDKLQILFVLSPSAFVYTECLISVAALLNPSLIDLFNSRELKYIWTKEKIAKLLQMVKNYGGFNVVDPSVLFGALSVIFKWSGWTFGFTRAELCSQMNAERKILLSYLGKKALLKVRKKGKRKVGKKTSSSRIEECGGWK